jgi:hypothetical protein
MKTQVKQTRVKKATTKTAKAVKTAKATKVVPTTKNEQPVTVVSNAPIVTAQVANQPKPILHNKKFPVVRTSRTKMVQLINNSKGRFFTCSHVDKDGSLRTMNALKSNKSQQTELGYITVWSVRDKGYRNVNPQTLTDLSIGGLHHKATGKKPVA